MPPTRPKIAVYSDESGNTGPDLLSSEQPVFVYSFVCVPDAFIDQVASTMRDIASARSTTRELKFAALAKSTRGLAVCQAVLEILLPIPAWIQYAIVEKRYLLAAMMVETFLDPEHNAAAPPQDDGAVRQELAQLIYDAVDQETLAAFAHGARHADKELTRSAGGALANVLSHRAEPLARQLGLAIGNGLDDFFVFAEPDSSLPKRGHLASSAKFAFLPGIRKVDEVLGAVGLHGELIADRDLQFGPILDHALHIARTAGPHQRWFREFGIDQPLENIATRTEYDSHSVPLLQVADLVAGLLGRVVGKRLARQEPAANELRAYGVVRDLGLRVGLNQFVMVADGWPPLLGP